MILQTLRGQTGDLHDKMESISLSKRIMAPDVSTAEYAAFLKSHYQLMAALEPKLDAYFAEQHSGEQPAYQSAHKYKQIEADLKTLGETPPDALPADQLPAFKSPAEAWGAAYVIEGAAMGGMVIHRALGARPEIVEKAAFNYLSGGHMPPPARWKQFCENIEKHVLAPEDEAQALTSARATYEAMGRCLEAFS